MSRIHASQCHCRQCRPVGPATHRHLPATALRVAMIIAAVALLITASIALRTCFFTWSSL